MNKLVKYDGYNSSTPDCITEQFPDTGSLYQEYLNAGIINAYPFGSSLYSVNGHSIKYKTMPMENVVSIKERKFKKGLQRRIELIFVMLGLKGSA